MIKMCTCGLQMNFQVFANYILFNCENCKSLKYEEKECDHEFTPIKFEIAGEKYQVRKLCKICFYIENKSLKQSDFKNLTVKKLSKAKEYRDKMDEPFWNMLKFYQIKYHENFEAKYAQYIKSEQWKIKREQILIRDKYICQICKDRATNVHHLTYKHFESEYNFELVSLCEKCHLKHYHL